MFVNEKILYLNHEFETSAAAYLGQADIQRCFQGALSGGYAGLLIGSEDGLAYWALKV
jgi:hypothetical protein